MSKGSSYWGTATGKIGNTVVRVRKGVRVEAAYQPNVSNPRSSGQVVQRGKFSDAVGFYKRAMSNFFKMAFEDKKTNETDFNAFMRHNVSRGYVYSRQMVTGGEGALPYIGKWLMSFGSLYNLPVAASGVNELRPSFIEGVQSDTQTLGAVWTNLVNSGKLQTGDIVTIVRIATDADSAAADEYLDETLGQIPGFTYSGVLPVGVPPVWKVSQYIVDTTSEELLKNQAWIKSVTDGASSSHWKFNFEDLGLTSGSGATAVAAAVIVTRKTSSGLLCSTTPLVWNQIGEDMMTAMATDNWLQGQRKAWSSQNVILAGALV